jgi:hypothetical protein
MRPICEKRFACAFGCSLQEEASQTRDFARGSPRSFASQKALAQDDSKLHHHLRLPSIPEFAAKRSESDAFPPFVKTSFARPSFARAAFAKASAATAPSELIDDRATGRYHF